MIRTALELVKHDEIVRVNWLAIANRDRPDEKPSVTNQVPHSCGIADGENYFHGLSPLEVVSVAHFGLHPSPGGAGSWNEPMLYTCKTRRTPIDTYAEIARIPMNVPVSSTLVLKGFRCLIGIVSKLRGRTTPGKCHAQEELIRTNISSSRRHTNPGGSNSSLPIPTT